MFFQETVTEINEYVDGLLKSLHHMLVICEQYERNIDVNQEFIGSILSEMVGYQNKISVFSRAEAKIMVCGEYDVVEKIKELIGEVNKSLYWVEIDSIDGGIDLPKIFLAIYNENNISDLMRKISDKRYNLLKTISEKYE